MNKLLLALLLVLSATAYAQHPSTDSRKPSKPLVTLPHAT
jgi:hypothetical protein